MENIAYYLIKDTKIEYLGIDVGLDALQEALDQLESWNQESEDTFTIKRVREAINKAII